MTRSRLLRRDLCNSTADGAAYSFMVGVAEAYFIPFALAIGMGEVAAGLAFTIPYLLGATMQLVGPWGVDWVGSPKRWVILTAATQCASFVPLIVGAVNGSIPTWLLVIGFAMYWGSAIGAGPAWSAWVAALVPQRMRASYFGRRNRICQVFTLAGLATAGALLAAGEDAGGPWLLLAYALTFLMGAMGRGYSIQFLAKQSGPPQGSWRHSRVRPRALLLRPLLGEEGRLVLFLLCFQFAAQVASPFVASYFIRELHFTQWEYFLGAATLFSAKSVASSVFGELIARRGAMHTLRVGTIALGVHALLFALPGSFGLMIALMAMGGVCWAAYELASFILLLERTHEEERTSVLTSLAFLNAVTLVLGSLAGGAILEAVGLGRWGYAAIFVASGFLRFAALIPLRRVEPDSASVRGERYLDAATSASGSLPSAPETVT